MSAEEDTPGRQKATRQEIREMCEFIGKFENWPILNDDVKEQVIGYLDYKTRNHLSICSRADYEIERITHQSVRGVLIGDHKRRHHEICPGLLFDNVYVEIHLEEFQFGFFKRVFSQSGKDTLVRWHDGDLQRVKQQIWTNCNYYDAAVKFAERWMEKGSFKLQCFDVQMKNYPFENSLIKKLPVCRSVRIASDRVEHIKWWLEKFTASPEHLTLDTHTGGTSDSTTLALSSEITSNPFFVNAPGIILRCRGSISDDQFLQLKAGNMWMREPNITANGLNAFLKRWAQDGPYGESFTEIIMIHYEVNDESAVTRGLTLRRWDQEFMEEEPQFSYNYDLYEGHCYQIFSEKDRYLSLTLKICEDSVEIYWTGRKKVVNGRTKTVYVPPWQFT